MPPRKPLENSNKDGLKNNNNNLLTSTQVPQGTLTKNRLTENVASGLL